MKKERKRIMNKVMALIVSAAFLLNLTGCSKGVPEGYVPEGYVPVGYVPEGYISIDDAKALFSAMTVPVGYLDGTSQEVSDEVGYEIGREVLEMEESFVAADAPAVNARDWSIYTSKLARSGLTFEEATLYDRYDELCRRYIDDASLNGVSNDGYFMSDSVPYGDLNLTKDEAVHIAHWFKYNNPQYYFIDSRVFTYGSSNKLSFCIYDFASDGEERVKITNELFDKLDGWVAASNGATTWEKELSANNLLCKNIFYNHDYVTNHDRMGQTMYSAVMLQGTVCAGYAAAFSAMMNASGVDTAVVLSPTHAWNVVRYDDGNYYAVDVTWNDNDNDDDNPNNKYLNVGEITLKKNNDAHTYESKYLSWSPEISQGDCSVGEISTVVQLNTPQNLHVTTDEEGKIYFAWDPVEGAAGYNIEIYNGDRTSMMNSAVLENPSVSVTYHSNTSLAVRVRAEGGSNGPGSVSEWSEFLVADTKAAQDSGGDAVKLNTPENVKVTKDEPRSTYFAWDPVEGADRYEFVLFKDPEHKETWSSSFADKPTKGYIKLQPSTAYYYGVRAVKTVDGQDYYSGWNYFSHETPAESAVSAEVEKPAAPSNIRTVCTKEDGSRTTWDQVPGATGYQIRLYKDSGYKEVWKEFSKTEPKLSLKKLKKDTTYYYDIRAVKTTDGQEVGSDWVRFSYTHTGETGSNTGEADSGQLAAPSNIKTICYKEDGSRTTWDEVPGATEYQVRLYKDSTYEEVWKEFSKTEPKLSLQKLKKDTTYYFDMRAVKTAESQEVGSDWVRFSYTHTGETGSNTGEADSGQLAAPSNIKTICYKEDGSRTTWDEVPGATEYQVRLYKDSTYEEVWKEFSKTEPKLSLQKLKKDTTYYYDIRAVKNADGQEVGSDWVRFSYTHTGDFQRD